MRLMTTIEMNQVSGAKAAEFEAADSYMSPITKLAMHLPGIAYYGFAFNAYVRRGNFNVHPAVMLPYYLTCTLTLGQEIAKIVKELINKED